MIKQTIPAELKTCEEEPERPLTIKNDNDLFILMDHIKNAGKSCRDKLAQIKEKY